MQACIYERYGSPEVVELAQVERPRIGKDDLLVRVHAAAVTTADWRFRASAFPFPFWLPGRVMLGLLRPRNPILGMNFSGVVEATGSDVTRFRPGDAVFGATSAMRRGAHAEYVAVNEKDTIAHKPSILGHEEAAATPFGALSALAFMRDFGRVRRGQRVLIVGASGDVGSWAVQVARHLGASVTGVCSTRNVDLVRALGAEHVIDYTMQDFTRTGRKHDLIFDTVGVTTFAGARAALSPTGTYLPLNGGVREMVQAALTKPSSGQKVKYAISGQSREELEHIVALIEAGTVRPVIDRVYPMHQMVDAHRHVESRHKRGSVVVRMFDAPPATRPRAAPSLAGGAGDPQVRA